MLLFDTHAHLLDEQFDGLRDELLSSLPGEGVGYVLEAGCTPEDIPRVLALTVLYDHVYGAVGVHPECADTLTPASLQLIARAAAFPKIVAIGEIGLDYHNEFFPRDMQRRVFAQQIALAKSIHKPVVVHDREAHGDVMAMLRAEREGLTGVLHCYSGSYEDARAYIDMGLYIAFGGALTFKNATKQRDMAARLPLDRIVIETDCPYMTPVPHRGERNDPRLLAHTLSVLAEVRGMNPEILASVTTENALRLFGIEG